MQGLPDFRWASRSCPTERFVAADRPAHWSLVTDDHEVQFPAGFTVRADGDLDPRSWPYQLGRGLSRIT